MKKQIKNYIRYTTIIEKNRIVLIIIFVIAIIIVKIYLDDYDKRIKRKIKKLKEFENDK